MNLHVKQFVVRYQGVNYGPGTIIYDVEDPEGEKLIRESNGTIEALPEKVVSENQTIESNCTRECKIICV